VTGSPFPESGSETTIAEIVAIARDADHAMLLQQGREIDWDDAPRHLTEVRCPTLVIQGAADQTLELSSVKGGAAAIPGANIVILDGLGHRPTSVGPPAICSCAARSVLSEARVGPRPAHPRNPTSATASHPMCRRDPALRMNPDVDLVVYCRSELTRACGAFDRAAGDFTPRKECAGYLAEER
jgi:hypothetical protein